MRPTGILNKSFARRLLSTPLLVAVGLWLCVLPLLALLVLPMVGWEATIYIGAVLLVADLAACWFLCVFRGGKPDDPTSPAMRQDADKRSGR